MGGCGTSPGNPQDELMPGNSRGSEHLQREGQKLGHGGGGLKGKKYPGPETHKVKLRIPGVMQSSLLGPL